MFIHDLNLVVYSVLRWNDYIHQLVSTSADMEGIGFDGSGGSGDCHIRAAAAGGATAIPSSYRHYKMIVSYNNDWRRSLKQIHTIVKHGTLGGQILTSITLIRSFIYSYKTFINMKVKSNTI